MKYVIYLCFCLFSFTCSAQGLDCEDFNEGIFIGTSPQIPELEWKVLRKDNNQIEEIIKAPQDWIDNGVPLIPIHAKFELINECTYRLLYDETKMELDEYQISANENGGIIVKIERIKGSCFFYTSKSISKGKELVIEGKLCKQKR
ncbi:hypothetical protein [Psychroserpens algicola]|uniref:hypothetical protein n=1 Tax=Psychroserpens algicola TaxID=1719034 RepID=UPI0019543672|nr:hypothetical protein [Psychroserpens algicola]